MKKYFWYIVILVGVGCIAGIFMLSSHMAKKANEGVVITDHIKGSTSAKVVLTEYSDFQCPACGQFYPVLKKMMDTYGTELQLEYKHFPLSTIHQYAVLAAKAAESAGQQGQFWQMHDKLFENQNTWSKVATPQTYFMQYAQELGLDMDQFKRQMRSSILADHIASQFDEARNSGLTGTPSFFLDGIQLKFATIAEFDARIKDAIGVGTSSSEFATPQTDVTFGLPSMAQ